MAQEETILLHFDIDEQPAVNSIKDLRAANSQLRAERDKVNISTKEGQELVNKLNVSIDKNNKLIKDNSSALEKQRQNVGNYSKSIEEAAGNLNIMGTNVGALSTKLASFANPATAAVGIVTALGAAYASSAIGAKDLEFAQNQLTAATALATNAFAKLISSGEDGEGLFSRITDALINRVSPALAIVSKMSADAIENLEQVQRDAALVTASVNERNAQSADLRADIANTELTTTERLQAAQKILDNITQNTIDKLASINAQIDARNLLVEDAEKKEAAINLLIAERSALTAAEAREKAKLEKQTNSILNAEIKRREETEKAIKAQNEADRARRSQVDLTSFDSAGGDTVENPIFTSVVEFRTAEEIKRDEALKTAFQQEQNARAVADFEKQMFQERLNASSLYFSAAATLAQAAFGEGSELFRALAIGETIINTYSAATAALAPPPQGLGPVLGPALAAATIATGLANVARIQGVGFADGGWTGPGSKHKPAGIVHADEYVTPKHIVHHPAAQPHLAALERMRTGYYDGGFVANSNQSEVRQAQMLSKALQNQPPVIASWTEGRAVGRRVEFKEAVTRK